VKPLQPKDFQPSLEPGEVSRVVRAIGELDEFKGKAREIPELPRVRLAELDPLDAVIDRYANSPFSETVLKQIHNLVLRDSATEKWHRGEYKRFKNPVETVGPDGAKRIVLQTASPAETPPLMQALVATANTALEGASVHPVIVIARFALEFLSIRPFQHRNQRLAIIVSALLLRHVGYAHVNAGSLQEIFEEDRARYSAALQGSQAATQRDPTQFGHWLLFFVNSLVAQKRSFEVKLARERMMRELPQLQERILESARGETRITTAAVSRALNLPERTARHHLEILGRNGFLQAHGDKRGRYYTLGLGRPPS
jgi:Fic family protein